jgi:SET domain
MVYMESLETAFILQPSTRDTTGVGCFALRAISAETRLYISGNSGENRQLTQDEIPDSHLKYCPLLNSGKFLVPPNFASMTFFWYINHDRDPNVVADRWQLFAGRDIEVGEELTLYYPDVLTHPRNKEWVIPDLHV